MNENFTPPPAPPPSSQTPPPAGPLSPSDERTWAMLAHLTVLLNLVTGFLGPVGALVIYVVYRDRSRYVAFQAFQSFLFQLVWWVGGGVLAGIMFAIGGVLSVVLIGLLCFPLGLLFLLMPLVAVIWGVYAALEANQGKPFRYWLVGDWAANMIGLA